MKKILMLVTLASTLFSMPGAFAGESRDVVTFFEIPVVNMDRAVTFYETIMAVKLRMHEKPGFTMAIFPAGEDAVTGALVKTDKMKPGNEGPVVYLDGGENLQVVLDRVTPAGGQIIVPKTLISPEVGYFALFLDTEGNRLGLYSTK